jgi:hypothetical protein
MNVKEKGPRKLQMEKYFFLFYRLTCTKDESQISDPAIKAIILCSHNTTAGMISSPFTVCH